MQAAGRGAALAALLQASLTVALLVLIGGRWWPLLLVGGTAALLQLVLSLRIFRNLHQPKHWAWAAALSLAFAALVVGAYLQALLHVHATFTEVGAARANQFIGAIALGAPYLLAIPTWQAYTHRALGKKTALLALFCALLPFTEGPDGVKQLDSARHADWASYAWSAWNASTPTAPSSLEGSILITPVEAGELGATRWSADQPLVDAIQNALPATKPGETSALLVEFATSTSNLRGPVLASSATPVHGGETALLSENSGHSALQLLRSDGWTRAEAAPGLYVPAIRQDPEEPLTARVGVEAWIVNHKGATRLTEGWQAGPPLTAEAALRSAIAGGDYLLRNQAETGRFHYVVRGPSGNATKGYNYPRHAGTTWFLARLAARTGEERFRVGAERGVQYLAEYSQRIEGERAYILDPNRKDGKAWVGTTALAALAANRVGNTEWAGLWGRHVAASVDEAGQIRGNYQIADDTYPPQPTITYGQGQGLLALAALHADGMESLGEALDRASAYVNGDYFSRPGSFLMTLDEHWTCIASLATHSAGRGTAGTNACHAYLANERFEAPGATAALSPGTAAAGGLVEAFAAAARLDREQGGQGGWWLDLALVYGQHFLRSQYQGADALLLPRPDRLMGGYRNRPWDLDVQIDTVQHIGSALLGIEALLSGQDEPGSWS